MQSCRRWGVVLAVGVFGALLSVPALAGTQQTSAVGSTHVDQATVDVDWSAPGKQFQINAGNVATFSSTGVTVTSTAAVNIVDTSCSEFGCSSSNFAECLPAGNEAYDYTLPWGALRFGPSPGQASLKATFTCTLVFVGGEFSLVVDLAWSHTTKSWGGGWLNSLWLAPTVTGTASDGTTDYNDPPHSGVIVHSTY
jgi:hypothetical protein